MGSSVVSDLRVLWIDDEIVEDDPIIRLLYLDGVPVDVAASAASGIALATANCYSVILLDLRLPDCSGTEVLHSLERAGVAVPVIIVTGFADVTAAVMLMQSGARHVQQKPVTSDELMRIIRRFTGPAESLNSYDSDHATTVIAQIQRQLAMSPGLSLSGVARRVGLERHTIERVVRSATGLSYRELRRSFLMQQAARALRYSPLPIKAIAYDFGYNSVQAFCRAFKAVLGKNPVAFRREFSGLPQESRDRLDPG